MVNDLDDRIESCARWILQSKRLVVFTGAGISTDSGLPDYRGPEGVWTRRDKGLPPPVTNIPWSQVKPNAGHMAIYELQETGKLDFLISQNVDNLHLTSGIRPDMLAELHGNMELVKCVECNGKFTSKEIGGDASMRGEGYRASTQTGGQTRCACGGNIVSSVVHFGDPMPEKEMELSIAHSKQCDLFMVVGSSLVVRPAADMPLYALTGGAKLVIINKGQTPFDSEAHLRFWENIGDVLPPVVTRVRAVLSHAKR